MVVQALFEELPARPDERGEVPGRDPGGVPRFGGSRRILHVVGEKYEVAVYRSAVCPESLLAESIGRLESQGWKVKKGGKVMLSASRYNRPDATVLLNPEGNGTVYMVLVMEEGK